MVMVAIMAVVEVEVVVTTEMVMEVVIIVVGVVVATVEATETATIAISTTITTTGAATGATTANLVRSVRVCDGFFILFILSFCHVSFFPHLVFHSRFLSIFLFCRLYFLSYDSKFFFFRISIVK